MENNNIYKIDGLGWFCFKNKDISYTKFMFRIFFSYIRTEMSYNFPSLFLFITKLFDVWSFSEFLQIIRFIIIPCHKIICISRFIGNIPE